ncbi:MAG: hypothetical protein JW861_06925 [Bacteroidales bacterium]|nr:hypothetical protein [Bacteroidales bacterium]
MPSVAIAIVLQPQVGELVAQRNLLGEDLFRWGFALGVVLAFGFLARWIHRKIRPGK